MNPCEEKEQIYTLMKELIQERRELTKQYYALKERLELLDNTSEKMLSVETPLSKQAILPTNLEKEQIRQKDYYIKNNPTAHHVSFDRHARNIASILKQSDVPLSNKQLFSKLQKEFETPISYSNLTCNILPKIQESSTIPVEKAYRGFWQYRLKS